MRTDDGVGLTPTDEDLTFVIPFPPVSRERSCSGNTVAMDFCYQLPARDLGDSNTNVFNFLILSQNGQEYTVVRRFRIRSTPTQSICSNSTAVQNSEDKIICCDQERLATRRQFSISSSSCIFALMNRNAELMAFADSEMDYHLEQFQVPISGSGRTNTTFTVTSDNRFTNKSILLFRFTLGKSMLGTHSQILK